MAMTVTVSSQMGTHRAAVPRPRCWLRNPLEAAPNASARLLTRRTTEFHATVKRRTSGVTGLAGCVRQGALRDRGGPRDVPICLCRSDGEADRTALVSRGRGGVRNARLLKVGCRNASINIQKWWMTVR